jgi:type IV pilus assembly protein PilE
MITFSFPVAEAGQDGCCRDSRRMSRKTASRGFSLVELVVVVAVAAVLVAIAYPSYVNYRIRVNRAAAQSFLIQLAQRQHLHFLDARAFTANLARLGASPVPPEIASYYLIPDPVIDNAASPPVFTLTALARAGTVQAKDGDLSLNSSGIRSGHW